MSRIGRKPIDVLSGVKVSVNGRLVEVEGPKGKLSLEMSPRIELEITESQVLVKRHTDIKSDKALHGLYRSLIANMIEGVAKGFKKELEMIGVGYKAQVKGKDLVLDVGFSHQVLFPIPADLSIQVPKSTQIVVEGIDKQRVGQIASEIRKIRKPEPYKGKGIRYVGERVRRKAGKAVGKK